MSQRQISRSESGEYTCNGCGEKQTITASGNNHVRPPHGWYTANFDVQVMFSNPDDHFMVNPDSHIPIGDLKVHGCCEKCFIKAFTEHATILATKAVEALARHYAGEDES